jgi:hypothetical protein
MILGLVDRRDQLLRDLYITEKAADSFAARGDHDSARECRLEAASLRLQIELITRELNRVTSQVHNASPGGAISNGARTADSPREGSDEKRWTDVHPV